MPAHAISAQKKMLLAIDSFKDANGYGPSSEELAEMISVSETVVKATVQSSRSVISLQQPISNDGSSTIGDRLEDMNPAVNPFESLAKKEMMQIVKRVMCELSTKEAAILRLRFGLYDDISSESYQVTDEEAKLIASGKGSM